MRSPRAEAGQATVDYVAVVALLAVLLAAAAAVAAVGAPGVANAVVGGLRQALCVVSGAPCPPPARRPCTVASTRELRHVALSVALVRLDDDRIVLRERLSDGTVRLTLAQRAGGGVEVGVGARAVSSQRRPAALTAAAGSAVSSSGRATPTGSTTPAATVPVADSASSTGRRRRSSVSPSTVWPSSAPALPPTAIATSAAPAVPALSLIHI